MDIASLLVQVISGAVGGAGAGAAAKQYSLGTIGNIIAGAVGGGITGQLIGNFAGQMIEGWVGDIAGGAYAEAWLTVGILLAIGLVFGGIGLTLVRRAIQP